VTFRPSRRDTAVALSGLLAGAALAAAVAAAAWPSTAAKTPPKAAAATSPSGASPSGPGSSGSNSSGPTSPPDPVNVTMRPKEIMLPSQNPYTSGKILLVPLRLTCGFSTIIGTHGEQQAAGQYCRIRVALTGNDAFTHAFDVAKTTLTTTAGTAIAYSHEARRSGRTTGTSSTSTTTCRAT
jgi:hypothetical protein